MRREADLVYKADPGSAAGVAAWGGQRGVCHDLRGSVRLPSMIICRLCGNEDRAEDNLVQTRVSYRERIRKLVGNCQFCLRDLLGFK